MIAFTTTRELVQQEGENSECFGDHECGACLVTRDDQVYYGHIRSSDYWSACAPGSSRCEVINRMNCCGRSIATTPDRDDCGLQTYGHELKVPKPDCHSMPPRVIKSRP